MAKDAGFLMHILRRTFLHAHKYYGGETNEKKQVEERLGKWRSQIVM
jgi:hypothetical protein